MAQKASGQSTRSTVGTATEINDYLRLLYARIGRVHCTECGQAVNRDTPQSTASFLDAIESNRRFLITFSVPRSENGHEDLAASLREQGFVKAIAGGQWWDIAQQAEPPSMSAADDQPVYVVVDRLTAGRTDSERLRDSLETAFKNGQGRCHTFVEGNPAARDASGSNNGGEYSSSDEGNGSYVLEGALWHRAGWSTAFRCDKL